MEAVDTIEKGTSGPETKQTPVSIETAPPKEPSEIARLRKELGLPEVSPLLNFLQQREQKAQRLGEYIAKREKDVFEIYPLGFIDRGQRGLKEERERAKEASKNRGIFGKLDRFLTVTTLQLGGVEDAEQKVSLLEQSPSTPDYATMRDKNVIANLKKIGNFELVVKRAEELGYELPVYVLKSDFRGGELQTLGQVSEEKFKAITQELNKYFFLQKDWDIIFCPNFSTIASIIKDGGLTQEQRGLLEQAYQFAILTDGYVPHLGKEGNVTSSINVTFDDVFERQLPQDEALSMLAVVKNMALDYELSSYGLPTFYKNLHDLWTSGEARLLVGLGETGWDCRSVYVALSEGREAGVSYEENKTNIKEFLRRASKLAQDPEKMEWIAMLQELRQGPQALKIQEVGVYEQMYEKRGLVSGFAVIAGALGKPLTDFIRVDDKLKNITVNEWELANALREKWEKRNWGIFWKFLLDSSIEIDKVNGAVRVPEKNIESLVYFLKEKDRLFDEHDNPKASFIEHALEEKNKVPKDVLKHLIFGFSDVETLRPQTVFANLDLFQPWQIQAIVAAASDELLDNLTPEGKVFWRFFAREEVDLQQFLLQKRDTGSLSPYFHEQGFDEGALRKDFIREIRTRPENCRTYESLTGLFNELQREHPKGDELGLLYLKIAAAHRLRTIGSERTEVERIGALKGAFAGLYHGSMTPFEKLSWEILRRQLPFAANTNFQEEMRRQALEVESLDATRLAWVHQSVHNYASTFEAPYLKAFKTFLESGNKTELDRLRSMFTGQARAPEYTGEDREALLANPQVLEALDRLIETTSSYYEVRPETLREAGLKGPIEAFFAADKNFSRVLKNFVEQDIPLLRTGGPLATEVEKKAAMDFCLNVNYIRRKTAVYLERDGATVAERAPGLVLDAILDEMSQKVFTQYKDFLDTNKGLLAQGDVLQAVNVLGQVITSAYYDGEVSEETFKKARTFLEFAYPESITPQVFQITRLLFPVLRQEIDSYWEKFTNAGAPEMVEMLTRTGLSRKEAEQRVYFTDLVDFKKTSMVFVLEPMMNLVEENLARIAPDYKTRIPNVREAYSRTTGEPALSTDYTNPEVMSFIENVSAKEIPDDITAASHFLGELAKSPEAQAEKIARAVVQGYMDVNRLQTFQHTVIKNGKTLKFFPFRFYGIDMVVILENGIRVPNPKEFILQNFPVLQAIVNSLREGD